MFKPIIHNLNNNDKAYKAVNAYNKAITMKPTGNLSLHDKVIAQREWTRDCEGLLDKARLTLTTN